MKRKEYIESIVKDINMYTKNSLCQVELKYALKKMSDKVLVENNKFPNVIESIFHYVKSEKLSKTIETVDKYVYSLRTYKVEVKSFIGCTLKSFVVEVFQEESEQDLSTAEILERMKEKSFYFEYFAKIHEDHVEYIHFDKYTKLLFYRECFYINF